MEVVEIISVIVLVLIGTFLCIGIATFVSIRIVYGKFMSEKEFDELIDFSEDWQISYLDDKMLINHESIPTLSITNTPITPLSKWHIQEGGGGQIPRWSKSHQKIEEKFKELRERRRT